jgi:glycosyltransferase involved in cell wall biosynthesis
MKVAFVTHYCPHYRVKTFETLASHVDTDFYFYSNGGEWYWQRQHGVQIGNFNYQYLPGFNVAGTRFTPSLMHRLLTNPYDAYIKCINGRFALPATYLAARLKRRPFILWTGIWMRLSTPAHRLMFPLTRYIYTHADAIVVYGEHVKQYLMQEGVAAKRIFNTTHAIDNELYRRKIAPEVQADIRATLNIHPHQKIILSLGRLVADKGLNYLLEAFAHLKETQAVLVFAGTGEAEPQLREMAMQLGVSEKVRFAGYVPNQEASRYYSISDVFVLPSITTPLFKEPWGLVVNEAFNQGVPVIATNAVGAAAGGLVRDGENGFIVPERDSKALAKRMQQLLLDETLRQRFSLNAKASMVGWDNEHMVLGFRQALAYVTQSTTEVLVP